MEPDELMMMFESRLARMVAAQGGTHRDPMWISARDILSHESNEEWLVRDVWPVGRQVHIHAAPKTGKSLVALWIACCLAKGMDPFTHEEREPVRIAYMDFEMNINDVAERIVDMGFTADDLPDELWYYALHPALPPMDTQAGGDAVLEKLISANVQGVVFDTFSRIVQGDENSNDTYRAFFRHTGSRLKAAGIGMMRLDHEGHEAGRSRGASAKGDDVDVVFQLKAGESDSLQLVRKMTRMAWIPEKVALHRTDPLGFKRTTDVVIPNGTMELVAELDAKSVPVNATRAAIRNEHGIKARNTLITAAQRIRERRVLGL